MSAEPDIDQRRSEIEKRLRELREAREIETASSNSLMIGSKEVSIGDTVVIRNDAAALETAERGLPQRDFIKSIYLGESGKVVQLIKDYFGRGVAAELQFVDGVKKVFLAECIDTGEGRSSSSSAIAPSRGATKAVAVPKYTNVEVTPSLAEVVVSQPNWTSLRRPGVKGGSNTVAVGADVHGGAASAASPAIVMSSTTHNEMSTKNISSLPEPHGSAAAPRARTTPPPSVLSLSNAVTPRSAAADNEEDDLLCPPPDDFGRTNSTWLLTGGDRRGGSAAGTTTIPANSAAGAPFQEPSGIPTCPHGYRPMFQLGGVGSNIPRASIVSAQATGGVKHCTLIALRDFSAETSTPQSRKSATKSIAFRSNQNTMEAILSACTKELDFWAMTQSRVERLFLASGKEVLGPEFIVDGALLIASAGDEFKAPPPPAPLNSGRSISSMRRSPDPASRRSNSPMSAAQGRTTVSKPIVVKVYVNGEYGDVNGDPIPYRTVTIRPTYKTLPAVYTLLARELHWNITGRRVEILYSCIGEEIRVLESIKDGDSIVVSSGDRFIIPRSTSILHQEVKTRHTASDGRVSPLRNKSPTRAALAPPPVIPIHGAQARATKLLEEMQQVATKSARSVK